MNAFTFQYQQRQSIPQPPQGEVGSSEPAEEMEQSVAEQEMPTQPADTEMTEDSPGSPIVNEIEEET